MYSKEYTGCRLVREFVLIPWLAPAIFFTVFSFCQVELGFGQRILTAAVLN